MSTKISTNKIDKLYQEFKDYTERQEAIINKMVITIEKIIDSHHEDMVKIGSIMTDICEMLNVVVLLFKDENGKKASSTPNEIKTLYV